MKNFVICLSKIETSLTTALKLKSQLDNFGENTELFEGTYGTDAVQMMEDEGRTIHPVGIKGPTASVDENDRSILKMQSPGVKGCFYSHYRLWKKCVELNEPIIIWEDDIVLVRKYTPVDWDDILVLALGHPAKSLKYIDYLEHPEKSAEAKEYFQSSMPGCCGYAIKPQAAKILIDTYNKTYLPADNAINQQLVKIQIHNNIMGKALVKKDGKKSLTRTTFWNTYK
jgi:GR25 family glycosyltransferase involved in LPS biosynthesis